MSIVSVRLNAAEEKLFTEYAQFQGQSLSTLLKEALMERMEVEFDAQLLAEAKAYNVKHPETYTHDEVKQALGL